MVRGNWWACFILAGQRLVSMSPMQPLPGIFLNGSRLSIQMLTSPVRPGKGENNHCQPSALPSHSFSFCNLFSCLSLCLLPFCLFFLWFFLFHKLIPSSCPHYPFVFHLIFLTGTYLLLVVSSYVVHFSHSRSSNVHLSPFFRHYTTE